MLLWALLTEGEDEDSRGKASMSAAAFMNVSLLQRGSDVNGTNDAGFASCGIAKGSSFLTPRVVLAASVGDPVLGELVGDQLPFLGHFYPGGLGVIFFKVTVVNIMARLQTVLKRIEEIEEEDEEAILQMEVADVMAPSRHKHELSIWKGFSRNLRIGVLRDLTIVSVQRIYEVLAIRFLAGPKMAKSLVKNVPRSAERKAARFQGDGTAAIMGKVFSTSLKGTMMFWSALFTVNQAIDTWHTFYGAPQLEGSVGLPRNDSYARRLVLNALRCSGACVLAAVGASIGSAVKPGLGTTIGMNIAPQLIFVII